MIVSTITCTGFDNTHNPLEVVSFLEEDARLEGGFQLSFKKQGESSYPTMNWLNRYVDATRLSDTKVCNALHINGEAARQLIKGNFLPEVKRLLDKDYLDGSPIFKRVQINFLGSKDETPDVDMLCTQINSLTPRHRLVLPLNQRTHHIVHLASTQAPFDIIVDSSGGRGVLPACWESNSLLKTFHTFAGGLTPKNVREQIQIIKSANLHQATIGLDAETGLKDETGHLSIDKARAFYQNILGIESVRSYERPMLTKARING